MAPGTEPPSTLLGGPLPMTGISTPGSQEQGRLVRQGRWDEVDRENVAEEIESLGREQFSQLESVIRVIPVHMLKWDHQPERQSCSWSTTIATQRLDLEDVLDDNPCLKPRIDEAIARAYRKARLEADNATGLALSKFPDACPYSFDDVTSCASEYKS